MLLNTLAFFKSKEASPVIINILSGTRSQKESLKVRQIALQSLFAIDPEIAAESIQGLLGSVLFPEQLKSEALQLLEKSPAGAKVLFAFFDSGKCDPNLLPAISEALKYHHSKSSEGNDLNNLLLKKALLSTNNPSQLQLFENHLKSSTTLEKGKMVFLNAYPLSCFICHATDKNTNSIGPDLSTLQKMGTAKILRSLLEPPHETNPAHSTFELTTKTKKTYIGFKIKSSENQIALADTTGTISTFSTNEIESLKPLNSSIIQDSFPNTLSYNELVDLVSFLKEPAHNKTFVGACYAGQIKFNGLDDSKSILISARNDGFFDLQKHSQSTSENLFFHFYLNSNNQTKSLVSITSRDLFQLRVNGIVKTADPFKISNSISTYDLVLDPGSNHISIEFSKGRKTEGFYLHFTGAEITGSIKKNNPPPKD